MEAHTPVERDSVRLERRRRLSRLALAFERFWPALWPPLGVLGVFVAAALFGWIALLAPWPHVVLLAVVVVAVVAAALTSFSGFALPTRAAGDRRLEAVNGLMHRPLAVLADRPATEDGAAGLLWRAHVRRTAMRLAHVRAGLPHPGLAARDRHALRAGVIVALVAGVVVAGTDSLPRVADAFTPTIPSGPAPPAPELAAWITPPAYTHLPPIFLAPPGGALSVPAGSALAVSITGGQGLPHLALAGHAMAFHKLGQASFRAAGALHEGGALVLRRGSHRLGEWDLTVIAPGSPIVAFGGRPGAARGSTSTRIPWKVRDRYGVTQLTALLSLVARPNAAPIRIPIPLSNDDPRHASGAALADLSANPWAGLKVDGTLVGQNGAGLTGKSASVGFRLPESTFHNAVARALIAVRKELALDPTDRARAIQGLARLAATPSVQNGDFGGFLNMRAIGALLAENHESAAIGEAEQRLWELAWHYEAGPMARSRRELAAAARALQQALADAGQKGGPKTAELNRRIAALGQAIRDRMAALAKSLAAKGVKLPDVPAAEHYDAKAFEKMAQAMRQAIGRGDLQTARNEMAELQRLLQQLQNAQPLSARAMARAQQFQKGEQAMAALGDVVGREGGLVNHALSRLSAGQRPPPGASQQAAKQQKGARVTPSTSQDKAVQQALRRVLGVLMSNLADANGKVPPALGKADIAMRSAARALGAGANGRAAAAEREAIADLQRGGQQAMAAMAAAQQGSGQGRGPGAAGFLLGAGESSGNPLSGRMGRANGIGLDPFGRPTGSQSDGGRANGYVAIPDQDVAAAARAIQKELRQRDANPALPAPDRDYINRLLKQF